MSSFTALEMMIKLRTIMDDLVDYNVDSNDLVDGSKFTNSTGLDALNFSIAEYCKSNMSTYSSATALISSAGNVTIPSDCLELIRISEGGKALEETSLDFENTKDSDWETVTSSAAKRWLRYDGITSKLIPIKATWDMGASYATLYYKQSPKALTSISALVATSLVACFI